MVGEFVGRQSRGRGEVVQAGREFGVGEAFGPLGPDKYRGRIDAAVATRDTPDVAAALLKGGFARSYDGGRRESWC